MPKLYGNKENRRKEQKVESRNSVLVQTDESNQSITKIVISRKERVRKGDKNNNEEQSYDEIGKKEKQNYKVFENVLNLKQPFKHIQDCRKHKSLDFNGGYDGWKYKNNCMNDMSKTQYPDLIIENKNQLENIKPKK